MRKEEKIHHQKKWECPSFSHMSNTLEWFIADVNREIKDILFVPEIKDVKNPYSWNFVLVTKKGVKEIVKNNKNIVCKESPNATIFIYNERLQRILPFEKDDYVMYDGWYMRCDGKKVYYFDEGGHELWTSILLNQEDEEDAETLITKEKKKYLHQENGKDRDPLANKEHKRKKPPLKR